MVIPSTHSERNDSFNGNHGKRHPRAVVQSIQAGEGDLLGCINMVSAPCWQANGRSVHLGHQASLVYWKWPMKEEVWIWHQWLILSTHLGWKCRQLSNINEVHGYSPFNLFVCTSRKTIIGPCVTFCLNYEEKQVLYIARNSFLPSNKSLWMLFLNQISFNSHSVTFKCYRMIDS